MNDDKTTSPAKKRFKQLTVMESFSKSGKKIPTSETLFLMINNLLQTLVVRKVNLTNIFFRFGRISN